MSPIRRSQGQPSSFLKMFHAVFSSLNFQKRWKRWIRQEIVDDDPWDDETLFPDSSPVDDLIQSSAFNDDTDGNSRRRNASKN